MGNIVSRKIISRVIGKDVDVDDININDIDITFYKNVVSDSDYKFDFKKFLRQINKELVRVEKASAIINANKEATIIKENLTNIWFKNTDTNYVIHYGPTNSSKTYNSINRLKRAESGVYLSPLRLLSYEVYDKLNTEGILCDLVTGEEIINIEGSTISSRTVEMMDYKNYFDVVVIDESFMIGDSDRGKAWLKAILETNAREIHIISSLESLDILKDILTRTNKKFETIEYKRLTPLVFKDETYPYNNPLPGSVFITFSRIDVLMEKARLESLGYDVSILYGNLPPEVKKEQMRKFIEKETNICISTDVIGMGLNLPCEHIIFLKTSKYDGYQIRFLNTTEVKQIGGRAGRYGMYKTGYVWSLSHNEMIKKNLFDENKNTEKAYCGISYDSLSKFDGNILDKLRHYSKVDFIPNELKDIVVLEDINKYIQMCIGSTNILNIKDTKTAWTLLNLPVKKKLDFWDSVVTKIYRGKNINIPFTPLDIVDIVSLEVAEEMISNIELLCYLYNTSIGKTLISDTYFEEIISTKYIIIDNINKYLLDKKLGSVKKCGKCGKNIGIDNRNKLCDYCYYML